METDYLLEYNKPLPDGLSLPQSSGKFSGALRFMFTPRPQFLLPGSAAVILGTALGYGVCGSFDVVAAILALVSIVLFNGGANMVNDYYDHVSGNDWLNKNISPFSGGSRSIQNGIVTPRAMLLGGLSMLCLGSVFGLAIVLIKGSLFILVLGVIGVLGGFFWTAPPLRICYRLIGEPFIFVLFGLLPVYGAYYIQTGSIDFLPLLPAVILGILVALVLLINNFLDIEADTAVNKRTLVVRYGVKAGVLVYRISLAVTFVAAAAMMVFFKELFWGGFFYCLMFPAAVFAAKSANAKDMAKPGYFLANKITIIYHFASAIIIGAGFVYYGLTAGQ